MQICLKPVLDGSNGYNIHGYELVYALEFGTMSFDLIFELNIRKFVCALSRGCYCLFQKPHKAQITPSIFSFVPQ